MSYRILATSSFTKQLKALIKKYPSLPGDLQKLEPTLNANPTTGVALGKNCYKVRLSISSKGKGKSAGARIITYVLISRQTIYLLTIYDKSQRESITVKELQYLINLVTSEF